MKKILLVEDDALLNKTLTYNLVSEGCFPYRRFIQYNKQYSNSTVNGKLQIIFRKRLKMRSRGYPFPSAARAVRQCCCYQQKHPEIRNRYLRLKKRRGMRSRGYPFP